VNGIVGTLKAPSFMVVLLLESKPFISQLLFPREKAGRLFCAAPFVATSAAGWYLCYKYTF
jgi:hypothetical protein